MTLVELLVVVAILGVLLTFTLSGLSRVRLSARTSDNNSKTRQVQQAVVLYAADWRDLPPTLYKMPPSDRAYEPQWAMIRDRPVGGTWFNQAMQFHWALSPALSAEILHSPGRPRDGLYTWDGIRTSQTADFAIPDCLFATPAYWNRWTQRGPSQWGVQPLSSIVFPSDKGLVYQPRYVDGALDVTGMSPAEWSAAKTPVAFADGSVARLSNDALHPGEPNMHNPWGNDTNILSDGAPISETLDGVAGRDRGGQYRRPRPPRAP